MSFTITSSQIFIYASALIILFITPGPVWIAIIARTISGGKNSGLSLVLGVSLGDMLWPFVVFLGIGYLFFYHSDYLTLFRLLCSIILGMMGLQIILNSRKGISSNSKLHKNGFFAGLTAGFFAVTANPKAALFYITLLPGFFDFFTIKVYDLLFISLISFSIPFVGNLVLIIFLVKIRNFISSEKAMMRLNLVSGIMLIFVAMLILLNP